MSERARKEAFLNEYKGNLLEFLLSQKLARHYGRENDFYLHLNRNLQEQLCIYEEYIRANDSELFERLPHLSDFLFNSLLTSAYLPKMAENVYLLGKYASHADLEKNKEADILIASQDEKQRKCDLALSLKCIRRASFVNTKSGGVKSFFIKYFSVFKEAQALQENLNEFIDLSFSRFSYALHELCDREYDDDFREMFKSKTNKEEKPFLNLKESENKNSRENKDDNLNDIMNDVDDELENISDRPGDLPLEMKKELYEYYRLIIEKIYQGFKYLEKRDSILFLDSLFPLLGFSDEKILQVILFYQNFKDKRYMAPSVFINTKKQMSHIMQDGYVLEDALKTHSSFEIKFKKFFLQIRVKPMNKFTSPSMKVNCSIKYL